MALPKPEDRLVCRIIATDGTWHRPFTTLDLGALQSLFDPEDLFFHDGEAWRCRQAFDLEGGSDVTKREWIGNAVPGASATGMAETIGETLNQHKGAHGFLLRRHGLYTWGENLAQAKRHIEILEFLLETMGRTLHLRERKL